MQLTAVELTTGSMLKKNVDRLGNDCPGGLFISLLDVLKGELL